MIKLGEIVMILELHRQGVSVSAIARQLGIDRKTVRKHIAAGLAAGSSTGMDRQNVIAEPFGENASATRRRHATEAPCHEGNADHTPGKRQIREPSLITAVNVHRSQTAIRALSCRADPSRLNGRRHTVHRTRSTKNPSGTIADGRRAVVIALIPL